MFTEWQYYTIRAIGKLVQKLSYPTVVRWGRKLGPLVSRIMKKQYNRAVFQAVRGLECSETEARQIVDELFRNLGQSALEILYTPNLNAGNIAEYVTLDHPERLDEALKEDKGVIILTGHIGNWEWLGALALYGYPASTIVKNQANSSVTRLLNENREGMGLEVFARGGNEMIIAARALRTRFPSRSGWRLSRCTPAVFGENEFYAKRASYVCPEVSFADCTGLYYSR